MRLTVRVQGKEAPPRYREQAQSRIRLAIGRHGGRIGRVDVFLVDVNGPRGGVDLRCRIVASVRGGRQLVAEGAGVDAGQATDAAVERLARAAERALEQRSRRAGPLPQLRWGGAS